MTCWWHKWEEGTLITCESTFEGKKCKRCGAVIRYPVNKLIVPEDTEKKFEQIINDLIDSKSMDSKEVYHWVSMLPTMTDEQVKSLKKKLRQLL